MTRTPYIIDLKLLTMLGSGLASTAFGGNLAFFTWSELWPRPILLRIVNFGIDEATTRSIEVPETRIEDVLEDLVDFCTRELDVYMPPREGNLWNSVTLSISIQDGSGTLTNQIDVTGLIPDGFQGKDGPLVSRIFQWVEGLRGSDTVATAGESGSEPTRREPPSRGGSPGAPDGSRTDFASARKVKDRAAGLPPEPAEIHKADATQSMRDAEVIQRSSDLEKLEGFRVPFVVGLMADLSGDSKRRPPLRERSFWRVETDRIDDVLHRFRPRLEIDLPGGPVELHFTCMDHFTPAAILDRLPSFQNRANNEVSEDLEALLIDERFCSLQATWRSLELLMQDMEFGPERWLEILDVGKAELAADFDRAAGSERSVLLQRLKTERIGSSGEIPFGVLIGDYSFTSSDLRLLESIGWVAAESFTPFIASWGPPRLEEGDDASLPAPLPPVERDQIPTIQTWNRFRNSDHSRWVALAQSEAPFGGPRFVDARAPEGGIFPVVSGHRQKEPVRGKLQFRWAAKIASSSASNVWPIRSEVEEYTSLRGTPPPGFSHGEPQEGSQAGPLSSRFSVVLAEARLAHSLQLISRDLVGRTAPPEDHRRVLQTWIQRHVCSSEEPLGGSDHALYLTYARIELVEDSFRGGGPLISARLHIGYREEPHDDSLVTRILFHLP